ncbi:MAG: cyclic nucleotide-binding domain-containing protein [Planctomycetota bacterium]
MDRIQALSGSAIFEEISREVVEELCSRGREVAFKAGHRLFERDQDADELMIVQEGVVDLVFPVQVLTVTREVTMESVQPGDVVAWSALVSPNRFTLSARCASECVLIALSRDHLHAFFETDPYTGYLFMRNLAGVIGRRLQAMQTMWVRELQATAMRRME